MEAVHVQVLRQTESSRRQGTVAVSQCLTSGSLAQVWCLLTAEVPYQLHACLQSPHGNFAHRFQHCWWRPLGFSN